MLFEKLSHLHLDNSPQQSCPCERPHNVYWHALDRRSPIWEVRPACFLVTIQIRPEVFPRLLLQPQLWPVLFGGTVNLCSRLWTYILHITLFNVLTHKVDCRFLANMVVIDLWYLLPSCAGVPAFSSITMQSRRIGSCDRPSCIVTSNPCAHSCKRHRDIQSQAADQLKKV